VTQSAADAANEANPAWPGADISRAEWTRAWGTVAANSFGGPAGQIAVMHEEIVEKRATYLGWLLRGPLGGLFAGALFILPGFISIMALSILFAVYGDVDWVSGLFFGITAAVIAVVANAVLRIGRRVIKNPTMLAIAAAAFVAIFFFNLPFPLVVIVAALIGLVGDGFRPDTFNIITGHDEDSVEDDGSALVSDAGGLLARPSLARAMRVLLIGLALWFGPVGLLFVLAGKESVYLDVAQLFSTAAVLTLGGAYSVLAYISGEAVSSGWLESDEMLSGLGMAETTPGPLIQVVQFVGFMGPYRDPGSLTPLQAGISGSVVATWVTFVPSFLWIFLGAPFIENLRGFRALTSALSTVTAAVVGVILNLAIWFGLSTLFANDGQQPGFFVPELSTFDWKAALVAAAAAIAVFKFKVPTLRLVFAAAVAGIVLQLAF